MEIDKYELVFKHIYYTIFFHQSQHIDALHCILITHIYIENIVATLHVEILTRNWFIFESSYCLIDKPTNTIMITVSKIWLYYWRHYFF